MKKTIIAFTIVILLLDVYFLMVTNSKPQVINALIVYEEESTNHLDTYQHFKQTLVANTKVETMPVNVLDSVDLTNYEVIYLDQSIIGTPSFNNAKEPIQDFVRKGGHLFLENEFYKEFPKSFLGAKAFKEIDEIPENLDYPVVNRDIKGVQNTIKQFSHDLLHNRNIKDVDELQLGVGVIPSDAQPIVTFGDLSLYTLNQYKDGSVFLASKLLPNDQFLTSFDFSKQNPNQESFNYTYMTGNYLFRNEYLSYVAKEMYGYSVSKVIGTHGRPGFAMEYTIEHKQDFKNNNLQSFMEKIQTEKLVPSLSLAREIYEPDTWKETISSHINTGNPSDPLFEGEQTLFSSGTPLKAGNHTLTLQTYPHKVKFNEEIKLPYRAYIDTADVNKDGHADLIAGSADGKLHYYEGTKQDKDQPWQLKSKGYLRFETDQIIDLGNYTTPTFYDYNKDGLVDIITGNQAGDIVALIQNEDEQFEAPVDLVDQEKSHSMVAPVIRDIDGDEIDDLIYGTSEGEMFYRLGEKEDTDNTSEEESLLSFSDEEKKLVSTSGSIEVDGFAAPKIVDYDDNDKLDLLIGMKSGYIHRYELEKSNQWVNKGYIEGKTENRFGSKYLWGGKNSVPAFADINGDQIKDLLVGQIAYGDPVAIDSDEFVYQTELTSLTESLKKYATNMKPHLYLKSYKTKDDYEEELKAQRQAFEAYGLDWNQTGMTYHKNPLAEEPLNPKKLPDFEGIRWKTATHTDEEEQPNQLTIPFVRMDGKVLTGEVYHEPNIGENTPFQTYDRFDLPFSERLTSVKGDAWLKRLANYSKQMDYNNMSEQQLYKSVLAAQQTTSTLNYNPIEKVFSDFQNLLRRKLHHTVYIENNENNEIDAELIGPYNQSIGYKVELGEKYTGFLFNTDAPIYMNKGSTLYFSGKEKIKLKLATEYIDEPHIVRSNIPIEVDENNRNVTINLLDSGMQQIKVYAPEGLKLTDDEWDVEQRGRTYILTRYGGQTTLNFSYK
ncbi:VCBS repeat-containing protein [Pseudalkalibacillus sp. SCS-8]|uniref:FG-GAP repeat domain-containing protein n=1 Tax=Pseudalkalibacillus nanhaiensis TaxID=3115291 RepID=UPI0032DBEB78